MQPEALAAEIEKSLWQDHLDAWFPRCVGPSGRFHASFSREWVAQTDPNPFVVFQARMTWVCASAGAIQNHFVEWAEQGARYLCDTFIREDGAVMWTPESQFCHVYGAAFALYGLAATHRATGNQFALKKALAVFAWLERALHDPEHGGYFEFVDEQGTRREGPHEQTDAIGTPFGMKSQNSHIHILEAFTELAIVWRDPLLLQRLREVYDIVRLKLLAPEGYLYGIALPDWTPQPWPVSYGHNIETAHLLISAAEQLQLDASAEAAGLVSHTLDYGVDWEQGGIYYTGDEHAPKDKSKVWWSQAEALLGFAYGLHLDRVDRDRCWQALEGTWEWIKNHQIDHEHGGWNDTVPGKPQKGHLWKAAYHDGRALLRSPELIRKAATSQFEA